MNNINQSKKKCLNLITEKDIQWIKNIFKGEIEKCVNKKKLILHFSRTHTYVAPKMWDVNIIETNVAHEPFELKETELDNKLDEIKKQRIRKALTRL